MANIGAEKLKALRKEIDTIDDDILELLQKRANTVLAVKETKKDSKISIYSPAREKEIIDRIRKKAEGGAFPISSLERIYSSIVSATRSLIGDLKIGYYGQKGDQTFRAAERHFGQSVNYESVDSPETLFKKIDSNKINYGVLLVESKDTGLRMEALMPFLETDLRVLGEIYEHGDGHIVGSDDWARFLVVGQGVVRMTGNDKTSLICEVRDTAGALRDLLDIFASKDLTLSKIESKIFSANSRSVYFFIDIEAYEQEAKMQLALDELVGVCRLARVIGSYPRAL